MFIKFSSLCLIIILCEATTKIGLGNGRPSEEPSSLKTEVMKFKSSECGGSSSEEQDYSSKNKKRKNRHKKESDEDDDDDDDSEEDNKKRKNNRNRNNSRGRRKNNRERNYNRDTNREDYITGYGMTSFEPNRNVGMNREPQDDYFNRRQEPGGGDGDQFHTNWNGDQNRNPYNSNPRTSNRGTQFNPYGYNIGDEDANYPQNPNHRNQNPYQSHPGPYNNNKGGSGYPYQDRNHDERYNRDDRTSNRRKHHYNWDDSSSEDDNSRDSSRRNRRPNNRSGSKKRRNKKNKNDSDDGDCISQCVFNNMQIMEDDGIPSEAGMIKWAQDKIKNEKLKQSAVKEIRKCFGTLASSDGENSCNFSKSLSNCLKLGLDDEDD